MRLLNDSEALARLSAILKVQSSYKFIGELRGLVPWVSKCMATEIKAVLQSENPRQRLSDVLTEIEDLQIIITDSLAEGNDGIVIVGDSVHNIKFADLEKKDLRNERKLSLIAASDVYEELGGFDSCRVVLFSAFGFSGMAWVWTSKDILDYETVRQIHPKS